MSKQEAAGTDAGETEPNFVMPNVNAVTEENWQELVAAGVTVLEPRVREEAMLDIVRFCQIVWGTENVLTGDSYDAKEGRPLRHKPGHGSYVRPEGFVHQAQWHEERRRRIEDLETG